MPLTKKDHSSFPRKSLPDAQVVQIFIDGWFSYCPGSRHQDFSVGLFRSRWRDSSLPRENMPLLLPHENLSYADKVALGV
jgi:hypothetical protein